MNFLEYQALAMRTAPATMPLEAALNMGGLGLAGEAGEVVDILKKHLHHGHPLDAAKVSKELGDVLWYVALIADRCGLNLNDVAKENVEKLKRRYPAGFSSAASINRSE